MPSSSAASIYFSLSEGAPASHSAALFLSEQLALAEILESDLPDDPSQLPAWMETGVERVGTRYHEYLEARKAGGGRKYFRSKAHALYFLKAVAPTKMVDGAWLYGLLNHWHDTRFRFLIQTYLEELGEGQPAKNHVALYRKLLASQGNPRWDELSDEHYIQGAIQLALAYNADKFLPEIIGFNLGYEQLPLHLLVTAYELRELGIDPYYFTLHITVDNADSGHAKAAVSAVFDAMPKAGNDSDFYRRMQNGYKLNLLGVSTDSIIEEFDLEHEMQEIFTRKGMIGRYTHSNYRRIAGRGINDWLSTPEQMPEFLNAMESEGWFKRHDDPRQSRFWKMIQSEKAKMFGVFSAYEQQVIFDWIAGDAVEDFCRDARLSPSTLRPQVSFEDKQRFLHGAPPHTSSGDDFDAEVRALESDLLSAPDTRATMKILIALMSPARHHSSAGLAATRIYNEIFN
jgi:hypothetical protein